MKPMIFGAALLMAVWHTPASGQSPADQDSIAKIVSRWDAGWKDFDARLAAQDFADDADWVNAFGQGQKGRAAVEKYLANLFQQPGIRSRTSTPSQMTIRFIRPDIAIVSATRDTRGQRAANGREYPTRKTHDLRVLVKQGDVWRVVSHQVMDEKEVLR